jgi:hypothetical protein
VSRFRPQRPSHWILFQDPDDVTAALVDDSIWSISSQAISDRKSKVRQDALTFNCLKGCSFDDFCSMLDDVFELHEMINDRGEPLLQLLQINIYQETKVN